MKILEICGEQIRVTDEEVDLFLADWDIMSRHWKPGAGSVFVDAGCGPGAWTLVALAKGAVTYSFDPKPNAVDILRRMILLNGFAQGTIIQAGLWKSPGKLPFGINSFKDPPVSEAYVVTLDGFFLGRTDRIDCINMDVEWCELEVLEGARGTLKKFHPKLIVEVHEGISMGAVEEEIALAGSYDFVREGGFLIAESGRAT